MERGNLGILVRYVRMVRMNVVFLGVSEDATGLDYFGMK